MNHQRQESGVKKQKREERRDALHNRECLLQAAEVLFAERGVDNVTMTDIARAAGVGQGTLYRHFAHRGMLFEALLTPAFERFQEEALAHFGYDEANTDPLQLTYIFLMRFAYFIEEHTTYLQALYKAYQTQGGLSFYQCDGYLWNRDRVRYYLHNAVVAGKCRADLDTDYITDALLAAIQVDLYLYQRHTLGWDAERILRGLSSLIEGLVTHPSHSLAQAAL